VLPYALVRRRRLALLLVLGVLALAMLTAQVRTPDRRQVGWAGTALEVVLAPAVVGLSRVSDAVAGAWAMLREIGTLRSENTRLRTEMARLQEENTRLRPAGEENRRLRALLGFKEQQPYRSVVTRVIGRDPSYWFSTVLVDRGLADGVWRNDPVVTSDGLVGHVIETAGSWSRVLLMIDPRSAVGVMIDRSREAGVAEGQGQPLLRVRYLARDADIRPGDRVVTSGLGPTYPQGLLVGTVVAPAAGGGNMFQEVLVRPAADLTHLEDLLIVIRAAEGPPPH
jgi:rod shape-determining protein MreC